MSESVALVCLCGGRGRRMGGLAKALLVDAAGQTLVQRALDTFEPCCSESVVVAPRDRLGGWSGARIIEDAGRGPAAALVTAARAVEVEWLFVVGGDQPRLGTELLDYLWKHRGGAEAVVGEWAGRVQPLGALYLRSAVCGLEGFEDRSLRAVLEAVEAKRVVLGESLGVMVEGINTPEEARALGFGPAARS